MSKSSDITDNNSNSIQVSAKLCDTSRFNQFIRLPLHVAISLRERALTSYLTSSKVEGSSYEKDDHKWNITQEVGDETSKPSFLPLEISYNGTKFYGSYNGGYVVNGITELPKFFSDSFGRDVMFPVDGAFNIHVQALSTISNAQRVEFVPVNVQDWELLEMHSEELENELLLKQVSIVYHDQILPVSIPHDPESTSSLFMTASVKVIIHSLFDESESPCARLVQSTEVCIKPIKRGTNSGFSYGKSSPLRLLPTLDDIPTTALDLCREGLEVLGCFYEKTFSCNEPIFHYHQPPSVPEFSVIVHPETLKERVPGYNDLLKSEADNFLDVFVYKDNFDSVSKDTSSSREIQSNAKEITEQNVVVARLQCSTSIPRDHAALHIGIQLQLNIRPLLHYISIEVYAKNASRHVNQAFAKHTDTKFIFQPLIVYERPISDEMEQWISCPQHCKDIVIPYFDERRQARLNLVEKISSEPRKLFVSFLNSLPSADAPLSLPLIFTAKSDDFGLDGTLWWLSVDESNESDTSHFQVNEIRQLIQKYAKSFHHCRFLPQTHLFVRRRYFRMSSINSITGNENDVGVALHFLSQNILTTSTTSKVSSGVIIAGKSGLGKTHLALTLSAVTRIYFQTATVYMDCRQLQTSSTSVNAILDALTDAFVLSVQYSPSVLILDDLDCIAPEIPNDEESMKTIFHQSKLISDHIRFLNSECSSLATKRKVTLLCTSLERFSINKFIRCPGILDTGITLRPPVGQKKEAIFEAIISSFGVYKAGDCHGFITKLFKESNNIYPKDIRNIVEIATKRSRLQSLRKNYRDRISSPVVSILSVSSSAIITSEDVRIALQGYLHANSGLSPPKSLISWEDVGGLNVAKQDLFDTVVRPMRFRNIYSKAPIRLPKGILLFGPSGCGKTHLVSALANEAALNLVVCKGPELLDKYIGSSEAAVRDIFGRANDVAPSLLFFDEFESLAPKRGTDNTGVTDRVVNQLLTFLDGVESMLDDVFVVAASTRPELIDAALLRPGRLDKHIYVGLPESLKEIREIIKIHCDGRPLTENAKDAINDDRIFKNVISPLNYSGSDLKAVVDTAHLEAIHKHIEMKEAVSKCKNVSGGVMITLENLQNAFIAVKPSISKFGQDACNHVYTKFRAGRQTHEGSDDAGGPASSLRYGSRVTLR